MTGKSRFGALSALGMGLIVLVLVGLLRGAVTAGWEDLVHMIRWRAGLATGPELLTDSVLWAIRLPRVLAGAAVGAGLAVAGTALQGGFRNEMADPHLVGIAPAAGLGAVAGIALSPPGIHPLYMMLGAALVGVAAALATRWIANRVLESNQFILIGLALGLALLALLGAIVLGWDSPRVPTFTFWVFGGLGGATWGALGAAVPLILTGCVLIGWSSRSLDLLALGEAQARHLGLNVNRAIAVVLVGVGLAAGGAVGLGGVIGFVGLVVPLSLRRWIGPAHRWLVPASALGGAIMVVGIDTIARTVAAPIEIPVGLLTAALGAPVLVWFLIRDGRA